METCRYCSQSIAPSDLVTTHGYWQGAPFPAHHACNDAGIKQEAFDCQVLDADCNDCKHFQRGELIKRWLSAMENGKSTMKLVNMGIVNGHCLKFGRPTQAFPKMSTGRECFEHRRS